MEPSVLLLCHREFPPDLEVIRSLCRVEIAEDDRLSEQLAEHQILYIWDYFWDRHTDALREAWGRHTAVDWVHIANVGIDKISFPELTSRVQFLSNSQGVYERPIAEYVLSAYLYFAKKLRLLDRLQADRAWHRFESKLVLGASAVVLGAGPIGREIVQLLKAVGMNVKIVGRHARTENDGMHIEASSDLEALVHRADLLVLAAPLTNETRGLIGSAVLDALGPEGILVNVGRGELVDDKALVEALKGNGIRGAALDVFAHEPLPKDSPYWALDNCLISSHLSGVTEGWRMMLGSLFTNNLRRYLANDPLTNVVHDFRGVQ